MGDAGDDELMRNRNRHPQFSRNLTQLRSTEPMHFNCDPHALGQLRKCSLQPGQVITRKDDLFRRGLVGGKIIEDGLAIRGENLIIATRTPQPINRQITDDPRKIAAGACQMLLSGHLAKPQVGFLHHIFRMIPAAGDPTRIADKVAALFLKLFVLKPGPPHLDRLARQRPRGDSSICTRRNLRMTCN